MRKIVLEVKESLYDKLVSLALSHEKSFSQLVSDLFETDKRAKEIYDEMYQSEFEKLIREEV